MAPLSPVDRILQLPAWKKQLNPQWRQARAKLLAHPGDRLTNVWEIAAALEMGLTLDVNRATADQWLRLPGISIRQAQVLSDLTQGGVQFHALDDVAAALGITEETLAIAAPLMRFYFYDPDSALTPSLINLNHTDASHLEQVPGMTPALAQRIVSDRQSRGPYRSLADLQRRLQLSGEQLQNWLHYLRV
ncbi:MAG: ComEA family DNA-binding protein [Cyanobacteria bacterium P01_H01_bin.130]